MNALDQLRGTTKLAEQEEEIIEEYFVRKGMASWFNKVASGEQEETPIKVAQQRTSSALDMLRR